MTPRLSPFPAALLAACLPALAASAPALLFRGKVQDPAFAAGTRLRVEVLESGDTAQARAGETFTLPLPVDTLWNICVKAITPPDDSGQVAGPAEKCFELHRSERGMKLSSGAMAGDSVVNGRLGGDPVLVLDPDTVAAAENRNQAEEADSTLTPSAIGTETSEEAVTLKKVLVRAQRAPKRAMGRQTVSAKLIKRMPGLAEADVIRSIQGLPGVVASSDFSTKIYVRGGGSDQNLILFDNAPVYSPVHFFGLFSTFLVEGIDDVTFYKGGFPGEYGDRLSSVLDIKSRKGGKDTADAWFDKGSLKVSTFATQASAEGRQGDWRWLFAGRSTYIKQIIDFLRDQGATDLVLDYYFYDIQGNVDYSLGQNQNAMLSVYQGRDRLNFYPLLIDWGNTVIPFNLKLNLGNDMVSRTTLSYTLLSQSFGLSNIFEFYNRIATWQAKESVDYNGLSGHRLTVGTEINYMQTNFTNRQFVAKTSQADKTDFVLASVYAQDKWNLDPYEISPSLRLNWMSTLKGITAEPRLSVKRTLPYGQALDFHAGWYQQFINSILFSDQESLNEFYYPAKHTEYNTVHPTTSLLLAAGWSKERWLDAWDLSLEGYYKTLNHLAIFAPNEKADSIVNNSGNSLGDLFKEAEGYSLGFETSLRHPDGTLFGGLSYSRGYSVIREDNREKAYYPKWHQPHSFKADLGINWFGKDGIWPAKKKDRYFRSSTQFKYASGLPYTEYTGYVPGDLLDQNTGRAADGPNPEFSENIQMQVGNYNLSFVPAYLRWDAKVVDWGKEGKWNFSFTILNLTDNVNVFFYTYDRSKNPPERTIFSQFPLFPFLVNYEWYF